MWILEEFQKDLQSPRKFPESITLIRFLYFLLQSNQTNDHSRVFMCFAILCFTLQFMSEFYVFSIPLFFLPCDLRGPKQEQVQLCKTARTNERWRKSRPRSSNRYDIAVSYPLLYIMCSLFSKMKKQHVDGLHQNHQYSVVQMLVLCTAAQHINLLCFVWIYICMGYISLHACPLLWDRFPPFPFM